MNLNAKDLKPGDWIEVRDPNGRVSYGSGGAGAYKVVKVGRVNVTASTDVRFSPTGPWFHQEHKIPLAHVVRVIPPNEVAPTVEETPTPPKKRAPKKPTAEQVGAEYARTQLDSGYFREWVLDQLAEAADMADRGEGVLPLETQDDALVVAKNMLQQLKWDTKRDLRKNEMDDILEAAGLRGSDETATAFFEGFDDALVKARPWLAEELLEIKGEMRPGRAMRASRGPTRRGTPSPQDKHVPAHPSFVVQFRLFRFPGEADWEDAGEYSSLQAARDAEKQVKREGRPGRNDPLGDYTTRIIRTPRRSSR